MRATVLLSSLLTACDAAGPAVPVPWLDLPAEVILDGAAVREPTQVPVPVANTGTGVAEIRIEVTPPFEAVSDRLTLLAGADGVAVLMVTPPDYASIDGVIDLETGIEAYTVDLTLHVALDGDADGHDAEDAGGDDCDDTEPAVHPGAPEVCDGLDNDCNTVVDDVPDPPTWFVDADGDGFGDPDADLVVGCEPPGAGWVTNGLDCHDGDDGIHPDAPEIWYDGVDQDCSGGSDFDRDGDGYESVGSGGDDCVDSDPDIHPGAEEIVDGIDNNCDGLVS